MDLICFSHLRWDFVFQRPQHLLTKFSISYRIFYIEEPLFDAQNDHISIVKYSDKIHIVKLYIKGSSQEPEILSRQKKLLCSLFRKMGIVKYIFWYYTPMALPLSKDMSPDLIIYDCMDELSNFRYAPPELKELESQLISKAHLVFTGGVSLYNKKKNLHDNVYCFPSSIEKNHFEKSRYFIKDPPDQERISRPRLGYFGVLDERIDTELILEMANKKSEWQFIFIGPITKISPDSLPKRVNIHYLGCKDYKVLPDYLAGWDIALMPFALNESTKFISPTKTPEYLAGFKPVISTPINDVVHPYGRLNLVKIASTAEEFIAAADEILKNTKNDQWKKNVTKWLAKTSWEITFQQMHKLIKGNLNFDNFLQPIDDYAGKKHEYNPT